MPPFPLAKKINPLKIKSIYPRTIDWDKWNHVHSGFEVRKESGATVTITDAQLSVIDQFVPGALARFLDPALKNAPVDPNWEYKIRLWENPIILEAAPSSQIAVRHVLQLYVENDALIMRCDGSYFVEKTVADTGVVITIPNGSTNSYFSVSTTYLDSNYAGWRERLDTALSLEIDLTFALLHVINKPVLDHVTELPQDITFKH